jgi:precorrin-6B methylase 1
MIIHIDAIHKTRRYLTLLSNILLGSNKAIICMNKQMKKADQVATLLVKYGLAKVIIYVMRQ